MQLTCLALVAAAGSGALASDLINEFHAHLHQRGDALLMMPRQATNNLQTFAGALGGIKADAVTNSGDSQRPFAVSGDTFTDFDSAAGRSCDNQKNNCAQMANSGNANFEVGDCDTQNTQCKEAITNAAAAAATAAESAAPLSTSSSTSSSTSTSTSVAATTEVQATTAAPPIASTTSSAQLELVSQNAEFNFFCEA